MSIPAKKLVNIIPGVVAAAGSALALTGLLITNDKAVPVGTVQNFSDAASVAAFFGANSQESALAAIYFAGFENATATPGSLLFAQYPTASVAAYMRGGNLSAMTLDQLKALPTGTLTLTADGVAKTSSNINLSTATSFSNAATIITAAFNGGPVFTYDAQRAAFVATSGTTGAASTMTVASVGTLATSLKLTKDAGAVVSQGTVAATPASFMTAVKAVSAAWASFATVFEPNLADKLAFALWNSQQGNSSVYVAWDTDVAAAQAGNTASFGPQLAAQSIGGTIAVACDPNRASALGVLAADLARPLAGMVLGYLASINFDETNGRTTLAFRSQAGMTAGVTDSTVGDNLIANGYNFYGDYATSSQSYRFMQPGQISGTFEWADSYANQIWMNSNFQQTLMALLATAKSVPYNNVGYSTIETAMADPINAAITFGAIRQGVTLSDAQAVAVNASAGAKIDSTLSTRGWYLKVRDPGASVRAQRGTPEMAFYYTDGGSIQSIVMSSLLIQ